MEITPNYDLDIDSTLGGDNASDYVIPSQKAIKSYVDNNTGSTVDQVYDPTSQAAQSGIAIAGANFLTSLDLTDYVTTNTAQDITGVKTFVGQKMIAFKQAVSGNKLGFTLYNNSGIEKGYLEFNPSNTVDSVPLMTLGNYATAAAGLTHIGFRKYSSVSGASGAYNLLAPLISDARTPFNLTTTYTNFYLPLGFTNGTSTVLTAKTGLVNISSLLPSLADYVTNSSLATTLTDYVTNSALTTTLADYQPLLTSGSNIKTVNNTSLLGSGNIDTDNVYWATYGTTTFTDIITAINAGKLVLCRDTDLSNNDYVYTYRSHTSTTITFYNVYGGGNTLVIVDSSNNWDLADTSFLPNQTSQSGKFLTTNGTTASWSTISYNDLTNKPTIPTVPTNISAFTNDSGYITSAALTGYATENFVTSQGYITGITLSDVTNALGYTPYDSTNPNGYTSNIGTVTSVNSTQPDSNGNVSISIPSITDLANKDLSNLSATGEAHFLKNTATGTNALTVLGTASTNEASINIGYGSVVASNYSTAIGAYAGANENSSIQLGYGANSTANSLSVGFYNNSSTHYNWRLLDGATGLIPDARISSSIARASDIPDTSNLANKDLSNLSATGEAKFQAPLGYTPVNKAGDTMTGSLWVESSTPAIDLKDTVEVAGTTPSSERLKAVIFRDKNNKAVGRVQNIYLTTGARRTMLNCTDASGNNSENIYIGYNSNGNVETYAPTPSSGDNSTKIATTAFVNTVSANKVDKSGDIMTGDLSIRKSTAPMFRLRNTSEVAGTTPSSQCVKQLTFEDNNGATVGYVANHYNTDGTRATVLNCRNADATENSYISIGYDANGNVYTVAPSPASTSNNNNIATTAWVNTNINDKSGWTISYSQLVNTATTMNASTTLTYSLANYLPSDNYVYEVMYSARGITGSSSGNDADISIGSGLISVTTHRVAAAQTRTSSSVSWAASGIMLIGNTTGGSAMREIYIRQNSSSSCTLNYFRVYAYRKLNYAL